MASLTLPANVRPAKPYRATSSLNRVTARAVDIARLHLRGGNPGAYARALAGEHRSANTRQQQAIEAVIASDGLERLFVRHPANGCLLAKEN
jgi:hypothetical protein